MKRYKQDCLKPYIESTHETMIEHQDGDWVSYKDMLEAVIAEREACAKVCDVQAEWLSDLDELAQQQQVALRLLDQEVRNENNYC